MPKRTQQRLVFFVALCVGLSALSCTHPLGAGFHFIDRQAAIAEGANSPDNVRLKLEDEVQSIGDQPLISMDARVPASFAANPQGIRIAIDGKAVVPQMIASPSQSEMRIALEPVWVRAQSHHILIEWDLPSRTNYSAGGDTTPYTFLIASPNALPLWQLPAGILTEGDADPDKATLTVSAPAAYRVLAPGKLRSTRDKEDEKSYEFRLNPELDFRPYVIAGRYLERTFRTSQGTVDFWTFEELDENQAQMAAQRLASSVRSFRDYFGPAFREPQMVHIVQTEEDLPQDYGAANSPGAKSFPFGVLLDRRAFALGMANEQVLEIAEYNLVQTWFGWTTEPTAESQLLLQNGLGMFGWVIAAENRGGQDRQRMVASLLEQYDAARQVAPDKPLIQSSSEPASTANRDQQISAGYKAALFFVALEDACGPKNLRAALRAVVRARAGDDVSYEDLRAAAEDASKLDLADLFRAWFNRPGDVPETFRARYGASSTTQRTVSKAN